MADLHFCEGAALLEAEVCNARRLGTPCRTTLSRTVTHARAFPYSSLRSEALEFLQRLAADNNVPLDEPGCRHILHLLGANWPILLQLFVSEIQDEAVTKPPTRSALDR